MPKKIVIDSNSLINLFRYYSRINNSGKLKDFLLAKISSGELIVIDKVKRELSGYSGEDNALNFFGELSGVNTEFLLGELTKAEEWYSNNKSYWENKPDKMENLRRKFLESADPYLILYCLHLIKGGDEVILVTEENGGTWDGKIYKKIPLICEQEGISCKNVVNLIFEEYREEIKIGVLEN